MPGEFPAARQLAREKRARAAAWRTAILVAVVLWLGIAYLGHLVLAKVLL
ncbi:hypothetical protein [Kaistia algarum]|nr:hypothetical protein [Kaistia algarum]MCX5513439.1 hypothetical protein [Kaistia algarum]